MDSKTRQLEELLAHQASVWLERLKDPTPEQQEAFVAWLKESPRNVRDFLLMLTLDRQLADLDSMRGLDVDALLAMVEPAVALFPQSVGLTRAEPRKPARRWAALAASAVLSLVGAGYWAFHQRVDWREFETAVGEQRAFELEDGSVVHLNTHSRLAVRYGSNSRDVRLMDGEALFRVRHDTSRPFRVYTQVGVVQAVGTQFDVYSRADTTVVAVLEGRVVVDSISGQRKPNSSTAASSVPAPSPSSSEMALGQSQLVASNQEATIHREGGVSVQTVTDVQDAVAWRERRLIFREKTLAVIASEFNRYSRKQIRLEGGIGASRRYSGVFDADDVDSLALVLARDGSLEVENADQHITVRPR